MIHVYSGGEDYPVRFCFEDANGDPIDIADKEAVLRIEGFPDYPITRLDENSGTATPHIADPVFEVGRYFVFLDGKVTEEGIANIRPRLDAPHEVS